MRCAGCDGCSPSCAASPARVRCRAVRPRHPSQRVVARCRPRAGARPPRRGGRDRAVASARRSCRGRHSRSARVALGKTDEAERLLAPVAEQWPAGEAALELGLLEIARGRRQAAVTRLMAVFEAGVRGEPDEVVRAARADAGARRLPSGQRALSSGLGDRQGSRGRYRLGRALPREIQPHPTRRARFARRWRIDPDWAPARIGLARALAETEPKAAEEELERALKIDPRPR